MTAPAKNTPYGIIEDAMLDAGLLQTGDEPSGEVLATYLGRLNDLVNLFITQGLKLWLLVDTSVTLVESQAKYSLKPRGDVDMTKPLRVIQSYYLDSDSNRTPLTSLSWDEWLRLGQPLEEGAINSYFVDKQATSLDVSFWLIPDATAATGTVHLLLQTQVTNPISLTETMQFPVEWRTALRWGLADDICGGQPTSIMERCAQKAIYFRSLLEDWDVEDAATQFAPDQRGCYATGAFR